MWRCISLEIILLRVRLDFHYLFVIFEIKIVFFIVQMENFYFQVEIKGRLC